MDTTIPTQQQRRRLHKLKTFIMLILIGCISTLYALAALIVSMFPFGGVTPRPITIQAYLMTAFRPDNLDSLLLFAPLAFGFTSIFFWYVLTFRGQALTLKRGSITGLLSVLFAHPLMWLLFFMYQAIATHTLFTTQGLYTLLTVPLWTIFEIVLAWPLWLYTLAMGILAGVAATMLVRGIRCLKQRTAE